MTHTLFHRAIITLKYVLPGQRLRDLAFAARRHPAREMSRAVRPLCLAFAILCSSAAPALADSCRVTAPHSPGDAEKALFESDYSKAETLFRAALAATPGDPALAAGLIHALLGEQEVSEAETVWKAANQSSPKSAILLTARGEIDYREGLIVESDQASRNALDADFCFPRAHLLRARLARLNSMYAVERREINIAHSLDPTEPNIRMDWISTLPLPKRIEEIKKSLNGPLSIGDEERRRTQTYLDELEKRNAEPQRSCRIASTATSAEIPFEPILSADGTRTAAWGLIVKFNDKGAKLEVDTGASGLYISRAIAEKAGLKAVASSQVYGIGDRGPEKGFVAYVDSIRIGNLEFRDCEVEVSDRKSITSSDGLIGMDIFADFLVSLNYPLHKLNLSPLLPRPDERAAPVAMRTGASGQDPSEGTVAESPNPENAKAGESKDDSHKASMSGPRDRYIAAETRNWTPVFRIGHNLILPTTLNNKITKLFILDTGAGYTGVSTQAAGEVTRVYNSDMIVTGVSGKVKNVYVAGNIQIQFADKSQEMGDVTVMDFSNLSRGLGMEISGLIGSSALKFLTIQLDYRDGLVKFDYDPRSGSNRP
jgi:predicted aspartyl protease